MRPAALDTPRYPRWLLAVVGGLVVFLTAVDVLAPEVVRNPASRYATIESLVERGTWAIDGSPFEPQTNDKVVIDGRTYSSKPPLMPLLGAGVYAAVRATFGWTFEHDAVAVTTAIQFVLQVVPFALFLLVWWRFLGEIVRDGRARRWMWLATALATPLLAWSAKLNNHAPAVICLGMAAYAAWSAGRSEGHGRLGLWVMAGLLAGLAITFDLGAAVPVAALGVWLLTRNAWRAVLLFGGAALLPLAANAALNVEVSGTILPVYMQSEAYRYTGSYWLNPARYDALHEPKWLYLFNMLLGHRGWLSMNPIFVAAVPGALLAWRRGFRLEVGLAAAACLFVFGYYWLETSNYGGSAGGMRWLLVTLPIWLVGVALWLDRAVQSRRARRLFLAGCAVGAFHAFTVVWNPWTRSYWERLFIALGLGSVP